MILDLSGQQALIVGSASGIGSAVARVFAEAGARVIVADLSYGEAERVADSIRSTGGDAAPLALDVTDWSSVSEAANSPELNGTLHTLINCVGTWSHGSFLDTNPSDWEPEIRVNLLGNLHVVRAMAPLMIQSGGGAIVNFSSDAGRIGEKNQAVYSAAKAGVIGFSKALAKELADHNIRVNAISPGATLTPATESFLQTVSQRSVQRAYPLGRFGQPNEIANAALYLGSDMSSWTTGQVLSVNGGFSMV